MRNFTFIILVCTLAPAGASVLPRPAKNDPHVRYVDYEKNDVTTIYVQRGAATRIILGDDEKIVRDGSATGFPSDCSKAELEWCMRADVGTNQILVKPKDHATHNNLELKTDKRDYSFTFVVLPDVVRSDAARKASRAERTPGPAAPFYRVMFIYPPAPPPPMLRSVPPDMPSEQDDKTILAQRLANERPHPKNWHYSKQATAGAQDFSPSLVFDDGRFTYFRFPAPHELPTFFYIAPTGEEARVNFHMDDHDGSLAVVERIGRRFVLRLGNAAIGIWNDAYDANGTATTGASTVNGVVRELRQGGKHD